VSARRTTRLGDLQRHVAFALGGEAAARLAQRLAIPTSPDTLLRMAARPVVAETPPPMPKILGVDDWAWRQLNALLRRKTSESLTQILDAAIATPLKDFAVGLRRDITAIQAALDLPWTTSPVEGQINRLKMLKRTMYGRAGFQLLRARVLHVA